MRDVADDRGLDWEYTECVLSSRDLDEWMRKGVVRIRWVRRGSTVVFVETRKEVWSSVPIVRVMRLHYIQDSRRFVALPSSQRDGHHIKLSTSLLDTTHPSIYLA
jgi:hypothetical protein